MKTVHIEFVGMFMTYLHTKFHMLSSIGSAASQKLNTDLTRPQCSWFTIYKTLP